MSVTVLYKTSDGDIELDFTEREFFKILEIKNRPKHKLSTGLPCRNCEKGSLIPVLKSKDDIVGFVCFDCGWTILKEDDSVLVTNLQREKDICRQLVYHEGT